MLGILTLDTAFPRIRGDLGAPDTFAFPVRHLRVAGATVDDVVHRRKDVLLPAFVAAGRELAANGCTGIATTCGFLARWQAELADALPVPVLASALLQVPLVERMIGRSGSVGIVTYSAADLPGDVLTGAGVDPSTPVEGVDPDGYFATTIREGAATLDAARMEADTLAAAHALAARHRDLAAIVLECANMPPYRAAVASALGLPVFDARLAVEWFHAGLAARRSA